MDSIEDFQTFADVFGEEEDPVVEIFAGLIVPSMTTMFILAGKSYFTLVNKDTGEELIFKVYRLLKDETKRHVMVRDGKELKHIGIIHVDMLSRPFLRNDVNSPFGCWYKGLRFFEEFWYRTSRDLSISDVELYHAGYCARCGRPLTLKKSVELGFGPVCYKKALQMMDNINKEV